MMTIVQRRAALAKIGLDLRQSPCPLRHTAIQAVPGEGSPRAKILFLGEAPGRKEDEQGRPFVGAAGRILDQLLAQINLKRTDVFITSVEKFRPPHNRDPKPAEIMACFPYLERQIEIIKPKIIVCLGRHALRRMLEWEQIAVPVKESTISQLHGKVLQGKSGRRYFPVYHPAAILYGFKRAILEQDFKRIPALLTRGKH